MSIFRRRRPRLSRHARDAMLMQYVEDQQPDALVEALSRELTEDARRAR